MDLNHILSCVCCLLETLTTLTNFLTQEYDTICECQPSEELIDQIDGINHIRGKLTPKLEETLNVLYKKSVTLTFAATKQFLQTCREECVSLFTEWIGASGLLCCKVLYSYHIWSLIANPLTLRFGR